MDMEELEIMQKNAHLKFNRASKKMKKSSREMSEALDDMVKYGEVAIEKGLDVSDFIESIKVLKCYVESFMEIEKI